MLKLTTDRHEALRGLSVTAGLLLPPRLRQGGGCTIGAVFHSVSHFIILCLSNNQPISMKLGTVIGPTNRKNWLTYGGDSVPDAVFGSLFHFPHH